jgi:sortase A
VAKKVIAFILLLVGVVVLINTLGGTPEKDTAQRRQELLKEYKEAAPTPIPTKKAAPVEGNNTAPAVLRIPTLGNEWVYPIVPGVGDEVIDTGVIGRFPEATVPGGIGNYSIAAHRVTHGEPFRNLPEVDKGDVVRVESGGRRFEYTVDKIFSVHYTDISVLKPRGRQRIITLVTCDSLSHTDERLIVQGHLTDVTKA